jgi:hypothetical protein
MGRLPDEEDIYLPDEVAISRSLADVGRLPYAPEQRQAFSKTAIGPGEVELASLPPATRTSFGLQETGKLMHATPLYYVLGALVYQFGNDGDLIQRAQIQRLFAVLVGSALVIVAYLIAVLLFPTNAAMRMTIPILVAFQPMITEITAVVSVDGLLILCYSLLIYLIIRVLRFGLDWRHGLAIGAVFAIGVLTKPTLNGIAPIIALVVLYDLWRGRGRRKDIILSAVLMGIIILIPLGWWMQRSYRLSGDLFYFNPVVEGHRIIDQPFLNYSFLPHMIDYYQSVWGGVFTTWWAQFGWLDTALPPWVYTLLRLLTITAIIGLGYQLLKRLLAKNKTTVSQDRRDLVIWAVLVLVIVVPIVLLQYYDFTFWQTYGVGRGLQGRYWLGPVVPMLALLVLGLLTWVPISLQPAAHVTLRIGIILLNIVSLLGFIVPRYYL